MRVRYLDLVNTIWELWKIPPKDVSRDDIDQALYLLSRKHEGGVDLDSVSWRAAGFDPIVLSGRVRASSTQGSGNSLPSASSAEGNPTVPDVSEGERQKLQYSEKPGPSRGAQSNSSGVRLVKGFPAAGGPLLKSSGGNEAGMGNERLRLNSLKVACRHGRPPGERADKRRRPSPQEFFDELESIASDPQTSSRGRARIWSELA
jgi:hypothetical protein